MTYTPDAFASSSDRMTCAALRRCRTSRYDEGSSNMYTSAICTATTAMAKRCSSPPLSLSTSRSSRWSRSSSGSSVSATSRWSLAPMILPTVPLTARGMWSTYCGLITARRLSSSTFVK
mmetsp:Transcript_6789/g.24141  ORF Transcript_6789/g.24141 Transcript_6789/m.24141 type:complete len:119 (+) Transcript_6789:1432-1788(+)